MDDSNQEATGSSGEAATMASIGLQPFWSHAPSAWFLLAETLFKQQRVTSDSAKYTHALKSLDAHTVVVLKDFLKSPPTTDLYNTLKSTLLERLEPSEERQLDALLAGTDIGDRRPSEALRTIRDLAGRDFSDRAIRKMWLQRISEPLRIALAAQPSSTTTDELGKIANNIHDAMFPGQQCTLNEVRESRTRQRPPATSVSEVRDKFRRSPSIDERLAKLESMVRTLTMRNRNRSGGQTFNRSRSRSLSRGPNKFRTQSATRHTDGVCWYHNTFGAAAKKCHQPCRFRQSTSAMNVDHSKND